MAVQGIMLRLLPSFGLTWAGRPSAIPVRAQRLVVLLALAGRPLQRGVVAARLWPDVVNSRANASLRATLWSLPRDIPALVVIENNLLAIHPGVGLELDEARDLALEIIEGACTDDRAARAQSLLTEDLLPDWTEEWLSTERDLFRQLRLHALDALCVRLAEARQYARAIAVGLASVACEPTRESAHRALMTAHLLEGNRMEALRIYHGYLAMARREMGIGPSQQLEDLFQAALADVVVPAVVPSR
jgi:DNA-binding SARP family transcriptional activator